MTSPAGTEFTLDGRAVQALPGESILHVARRSGIDVPHLCTAEGLRPVGNCRSCVVEVQGERVLAASCCRVPTAGMVVTSANMSERAAKAQRTVLELLKSEAGSTAAAMAGAASHELGAVCSGLGTGAPRFEPRAALPPDTSHPAITVSLGACIQCTRCVRACREVQANGVIGLAGRGAATRIVFDLDTPLGSSSCVACGECVQACPTGALSAAAAVASSAGTQSIDSLCPYCGVGCALTLRVQGERIVQVLGRAGAANDGRLCVKGRFGGDYVRHAQRLTVPLIRRADAPKATHASCDPAVARGYFREATWDEALAAAGGALRAVRSSHGGGALAGLGSAKGSNEEAYLFQKLVRLGFGSNHVDHCTRLCHASSVAALLEGVGSGAVSNPVRDVAHAEVIVVIGANPAANHPVAASWIKNAVARGSHLVLIDPRRNELALHAEHFLQFRPDADVALLNALMHVVVEEGLTDRRFIEERTEGFDALAAHVRAFSPEAMALLTGIAPATVRAVARLYATSRASMILWGMGIAQHVHGTDNARCLIALALMTGQIGRPGTGLHPLRGQNNVQGASDAGLIPMMLPDYQHVTDAQARARCAAAWGVDEARLSTEAGLTVVEMMRAAKAGRLKGMFVQGENPAMSDPDTQHTRQALAGLDVLVVQDIFLTETACLADVVLPASAFAEKSGSFTNTDRCVQLGRRALTLPGQARQDLWIIAALAAQMGLDWQHYGATPTDCDAAAEAVFEEMRGVMPSIAGISWQRLQNEGGVTFPCRHAGDPGERVLFTQRFATPSGRARFVPAHIVPADERPDADYPLVLITGRQLEHWHTGAMTRRSAVLDAIEPDAVAFLHPQDLQRLGVQPGERITLESRRGEVNLYARADPGNPPGTVFAAFCWAEAPINLLTNPALDPVAKIAEVKFCAVRARAGGEPVES